VKRQRPDATDPVDDEQGFRGATSLPIASMSFSMPVEVSLKTVKIAR